MRRQVAGDRHDHERARCASHERAPASQPHAQRSHRQQSQAAADGLHDAVSELGLLVAWAGATPFLTSNSLARSWPATVTPQKLPSPTAASSIPSRARRRHWDCPTGRRDCPSSGPAEAAALAPGQPPASPAP